MGLRVHAHVRERREVHAVAAADHKEIGDAVLAGVLPTPAAGILCESGEYDLAVVVSASHNVYSDNGIKFILPSGSKLDDGEEAQIEATLEQDHSTGQPGSVVTLEDGAARYVAALAEMDAIGRTGPLSPPRS